MKILVFIVFLLLTISTSLAQEIENYVLIEQATNVRSAPRLEHYKAPVISVITHGFLTVTGRNFDANKICTGVWEQDKDLWLRVDLQGIDGWVDYCVVDFEGSLASIPMVTATQYVHWDRHFTAFSSRLDELGNVPDSIGYVIASTRAWYINVRELPTTTSTVTDLLSSDKVYVIGRTADSVWVKIEYDGMTPDCHIGTWRWWCELEHVNGWVASYLLRLPDGWQDIIPVIES